MVCVGFLDRDEYGTERNIQSGYTKIKSGHLSYWIQVFIKTTMFHLKKQFPLFDFLFQYETHPYTNKQHKIVARIKFAIQFTNLYQTTNVFNVRISKWLL